MLSWLYARSALATVKFSGTTFYRLFSYGFSNHFGDIGELGSELMKKPSYVYLDSDLVGLKTRADCGGSSIKVYC